MKTFTFRSYAGLAIGLFAIFGVFGNIATAQESASLKIQPVLIEEKLEPGKDYPFVLHVTNLGSVPHVYTTLVQNISSIADNGSPIFADNQESTGYELSSWVKTAPGNILIAPNETVAVPFTVRVPKDATPGGHFGAFFMNMDGKKPETNGAAVGFQVGSILSFQIAGDVLEEAKIREFTSDKTIYGGSKATFTIKVENLGNTLLRPRGLVEISDMFGKKIASVKVNDSSAAIFPHSVKTFTVEWEDSAIHMGKYEAIASMGYGTEVQHTIFSILSFWIIPMEVVIPVAGFIFALALVLYIWVKIYIRRKMKEYGISKDSKSSRAGELTSRSTVVFISFVAFLAVFLLILFVIFA
jgi:hypothetical protein